jgi:hypothetical protein
MAKSSGAGGGINSRQVVRQGIREGKSATGVRPGYVDQLGNMRGTHVTRGGIEGGGGDVAGKLTPMETVKPPISVQLGNAKALDVGAGGPGKGRVVMASGSQGTHGPINPGNRPTPTGPDPLRGWFPPSPARQSPIKK